MSADPPTTAAPRPQVVLVNRPTLTCHRCWGTGIEPTIITTWAKRCRDCWGKGWGYAN